MAISEPFIVSNNSFSNISFWTLPDVQAMMEVSWRLRWLGRTARELRDLGDSVLRPLLLAFKRFDFRAAPRWRAQRWKAKT